MADAKHTPGQGMVDSDMLKALNDLVRETAESYFDFHAQKPAGNAGNQGGNGGGSVRTTFKDENDYFSQRAAAGGDRQKLKELSDAWKTQAGASN